jgi:hypothetical protein
MNQQISQFLGPATPSEVAGHSLNICDLMDRIEYVEPFDGISKYNYTVHTRKSKDSSTIIEVRMVPHYAITFVDRPYTSDIHTPGAFRRWIGIEDQRFPQSWRNARNY